MAISQFQTERVVRFFGGASGAVKVKKAHIGSPTDNTETDSGITLPEKCLVLDCFVDVLTVDATETVDVGTSGDASDDPHGFLDGVSLATAGIVRGAPTVAAGANEKYFSANTRGLLLSYMATGSDVATDTGIYYEFPDGTSGGESVSYTTSLGTDTAVFDIYVVYIEL